MLTLRQSFAGALLLTCVISTACAVSTESTETTDTAVTGTPRNPPPPTPVCGSVKPDGGRWCYAAPSHTDPCRCEAYSYAAPYAQTPVSSPTECFMRACQGVVAHCDDPTQTCVLGPALD
jgi:hypothetical protein